METLEVPAATYAVFTTPPINTKNNPHGFAHIIKATWKSIFENYFDDNSEYTYDFDKLDFEFYDERSHHEIDPVMEMWVPVKKNDNIYK